jgi:hypothetical protein
MYWNPGKIRDNPDLPGPKAASRSLIRATTKKKGTAKGIALY